MNTTRYRPDSDGESSACPEVMFMLLDRASQKIVYQDRVCVAEFPREAVAHIVERLLVELLLSSWSGELEPWNT